MHCCLHRYWCRQYLFLPAEQTPEAPISYKSAWI